MQILTGDIGGTHTRLAMGRLEGGSIRIEHRETFPSPAYPSLEAIIDQYLPNAQTPIAAAAFGVAGPVRNGVSRITNLPWEISRHTLVQHLQLADVHLLNDLEAMAWGIDALGTEELVGLRQGAAGAAGNRAVIAAGTGLGQAGLYHHDGRYRPFATEGGHTDFAPQTERDWLLLRHLQQHYAHVSWERLVSGPGLVNLYEFVLQQHGATAPEWLGDASQSPGPHITRLALGHEDELCVETLQWFVELYGREAGNVALKMNATGGLFLGGGIAPAILPVLHDSTFTEAFLDKGRMRPLMESIPVQVISSELVSLKGLVRYTRDAAGS